jgi:HSP20 family protein
MCNYSSYRYRGSAFRHHGYYGKSFKSVPVNIEEKNDRFELLVFAPALEKKNIRIAVQDDVLKVSYQAADKNEADEVSNFTRREYRHQSFERSFMLNGKVDTEGITATYADGILTITLPKNPEKNKPSKEVNIS